MKVELVKEQRFFRATMDNIVEYETAVKPTLTRFMESLAYYGKSHCHTTVFLIGENEHFYVPFSAVNGICEQYKDCEYKIEVCYFPEFAEGLPYSVDLYIYG